LANSANKEAVRPGKRERLTEAAAELIHRQGAQATTLAEIAEAADVPLGNVYYYFKTRDDLVEAVIATHGEQLHALLARLDSLDSPREKLKGLVENWLDQAEMVSLRGCPIGTLSSELNKTPDDLGREASCLLKKIVDWADAQLRELGRDDSRELALTLIGNIQGAAVLTNAMHDPEILKSQVRRLDALIDSLD